MQRRLLVVAALAATAAAAPQGARACDITKLKAAIAECDESWAESLVPIRGWCYLLNLVFCDMP